MIPKPGGKLRKLGIPTVHDRVVQQAVLNILQPIFDPDFSESSFGFRPKRSAHMAVKQATKYVQEGREFVVDIDLEAFFDNAPHDLIMRGLYRKVTDVFVLRLIKKFLKAGRMNDGVLEETHKGTPQGSPLSPLLSNILLDCLDLELEKRGHKFCRYADDCNIYVKSLKSAESVLASTTRFIEKRLKLKVNTEKSAAAKVSTRKFLGFTLKADGTIAIAKASVKRFKDKVREITKRNRGKSLKSVIIELKPVLLGWGNYFSIASSPTILKTLDGWIRRRLRCYRIKQRKRKYSIYTFLKSMGIKGCKAWSLAKSNKGWWRMSLNRTIHRALGNQWFIGSGLISLVINQSTRCAKQA
jgi:group II intron reverse transcriptase/maturase